MYVAANVTIQAALKLTLSTFHYRPASTSLRSIIVMPFSIQSRSQPTLKSCHSRECSEELTFRIPSSPKDIYDEKRRQRMRASVSARIHRRAARRQASVRERGFAV